MPVEVTELSEINNFCRDAESLVTIASITVAFGSGIPNRGRVIVASRKK